MKKQIIFKCLMFWTLFLTATYIVSAQEKTPNEQDKNLLVERVAKVAKERDKIKVSGKSTSRKDGYVDSLMTLKRGSVAANTQIYEFADSNAASEFIKTMFLNAPPLAVSVNFVRLTNLGDEAYLRSSPSSPYKQIILRTSANVVVIDSSRIDVARYFAKYFVDEAAKREKGL